MPVAYLYALAVPAAAFAVHGAWNYRRAGSRWHAALRRTAVLNLLYCCVTICLTITHWHPLTGWGVAYFVGEVIVILGLVGWEVKALSGH